MKNISLIIFCLFISVPFLSSQKDSLEFDPLWLSEVVISDLSESAKLRTPQSLTTIGNPADLHLQGVASTLLQVPGMFVDASLGDAFARVYSRGISLSAEDDIGWYYVSLQEDGLPVSAIQYNYFTPDFFVRPDVSNERIEIIKGGKSGILAPSGPGGIINYISKKTPFGKYRTHDRLTLGLHNSGRPYARIEGFSGAQIGQSKWAYDFGYLYRYDRGPRKLDHALNNGGQIKASLQKLLSNGLLSFKVKWLDDQVNRYQGIAAQNWESPEPAFGQSFQNTSLLPPSFDGALPDPNQPNATKPYDPGNGINAKELSGTIGLDLELSEWRLTNKLKYSAKSLDWQSAIGGQPLGLDNFITYFISGDAFPIGLVNFTDVASGQSLATVNNQGAFAVFQGASPSFEYTNGSLPNDAILGTGTWSKDDHINEWMNQLELRRTWQDVDLTTGLFISSSQVEVQTDASFLYATYEAEPRLLSVNLTDQNGTRQLSDPFGLSNYGGLFYEGADITASQLGIFSNAALQLTKSLRGDIGLRFERIGHSGTKDRSSPIDVGSGGLDGNPLTVYDNGTFTPSQTDDIDASYSYLSYSGALEYDLNKSSNIYFRYSKGNKAPELNYYINNFSNQDIPSELPPTQKIVQTELGWKKKIFATSITATLFNSTLKDVAYSNFVFDDQSSQIFYTPTQFNSSRTTGLELELGQLLTNDLMLRANMTLQTSKMTSFTLYEANGSIDVSDDELIDFSDNTLPHTPKLMGNLGLVYEPGAWYGGVNINYMGSRFGNLENSFTLPAYATADLDFGLPLSAQFSVGLRVKNLFNSGGLINFFGPNQFGSNSNAATNAFINNNPNETFVVFPIMPRAIFISLDYQFGK